MKVLIIGATGTVGGEVRNVLLNQTDYSLLYYSRHVDRFTNLTKQENIQVGDIFDFGALRVALDGVDIVFASLSGDLTKMVSNIVDAMNEAGVKRIIFISSMGIYNEIPASIGADGNVSRNPALNKYRDSAEIIENSGLSYTIIRPGWFDWGSDDYQITRKGEPFGGHNVSVPAIANLVKKLITGEIDGTNQSFGINRA